MEAALGWLGEIFKTIGRIFPRLKLIRSTHRGVKFVRHKTLEIGPGLHWWWPVTTEIEIHPVVRMVLSLEQQVLMTKDSLTIVVDGVLVFSINDIHAFLTENDNAEASLAEVSQASLRDALLTLTLEEINSGRVKLDRRLTKEAIESLSHFGVDVESMRLQSCAQGTVLIHAGNMIGISQFGE